MLRQSAENGDAVGQMRLGRAYSLGLGVPKDAQLAQQWLRRAAAQGNTDAKSFLKKIYDIDQ
jgi:TPR repeat protein